MLSPCQSQLSLKIRLSRRRNDQLQKCHEVRLGQDHHTHDDTWVRTCMLRVSFQQPEWVNHSCLCCMVKLSASTDILCRFCLPLACGLSGCYAQFQVFQLELFLYVSVHMPDNMQVFPHSACERRAKDLNLLEVLKVGRIDLHTWHRFSLHKSLSHLCICVPKNAVWIKKDCIVTNVRPDVRK